MCLCGLTLVCATWDTCHVCAMGVTRVFVACHVCVCPTCHMYVCPGCDMRVCVAWV